MAPSRLPDLYAGCPALAAARLSPKGGTLIVRGRTAEGEWEERVRVPAIEPGEGPQAAAALFARETVEDLGAHPRRRQGRRGGGHRAAGARLPNLHAPHHLGRHLRGDRRRSAGADAKELVPQELPYGVSAEGVGLRQTASVHSATTVMPAPMRSMAVTGLFALPPAPPQGGPGGGGVVSRGRKEKAAPAELERAKKSDDSFELDEEAPAPEQKVAAPEGGALMGDDQGELPPARKFKARVRLAKDGRIVLEVTVDGRLDWMPPEEVLVEMADGTRVMARVVVAASTRAGQLEAGQTARLVIELPSAPVRVHFGDLELEIA